MAPFFDAFKGDCVRIVFMYGHNSFLKAPSQKAEEKNFSDVITDLINNDEFEKAEPLVLNAYKRHPDSVFLLTALGIIYRGTKRRLAAEACYRRALALDPDNAQLCSNFANLLIDLNKVEEALGLSKKATELEPETYVFRKNYASALMQGKRYRESLEEYFWCLEKKPEDMGLQFDIAYVYLYLRDFDHAWHYFEERFNKDKSAQQVEEEKERLKNMSVQKWTGQDLKGKKLLILSEQGFGDTLLMTRFLDRVAQDCDDITLACKPALHTLFSELPVKLVEQDSAISTQDYDYFVHFMSIAPIYEQDWLKWPKPAAMHIPQSSRGKYGWIQEHGAGKLKIGIVWSGSVTFGGNDKRAVDLDRFLSLVNHHHDVQFYSFQKGPCEAALEEYGSATIFPLGQSFDDFSQTAAAAQEMDCIIMTDSALAHLSGMIGVPVLDLLHFTPYWLYFPEESKTPLYPSLRFLRQKNHGEWDEVFEVTDGIITALKKAHKGKDITSDKVLKVMDKILDKRG